MIEGDHRKPAALILRKARACNRTVTAPSYKRYVGLLRTALLLKEGTS
jgi:hypothetical protein